MIGTASPRSCSAAPATAAAGCSRRSDIVERARQLGDARADDLGLGLAQRRDLGLARGRVEGDRRQPEQPLQRALLGVDVLHPADRDDRAAHDEHAVADVDLLLAHGVAPAPVAQGRTHRDGAEAGGGDGDRDQPRPRRAERGARRRADDHGDDGGHGGRDAPVRERRGGQALGGLGQRRGGLHARETLSPPRRISYQPMVNKESAMESSTAAAPRDKRFLLARVESRALTWIAERLPARVMPDHLTALGVLAALGIAAAYVLSNGDRAWLWAASGLLVVHWLGDSLDGTLARVRRIERPTYGYYLDHLVDAIATALIGLGLGLSPFLLLASGLVIVAAYLVLSINTYLEMQALGVFTLGYGRLGPTEARLGLVALNTALALGAPLGFHLAGVGLTVLDVIALGASGLMLAGLLVRAAHNLKELAARDPVRHNPA